MLSGYKAPGACDHDDSSTPPRAKRAKKPKVNSHVKREAGQDAVKSEPPAPAEPGRIVQAAPRQTDSNGLFTTTTSYGKPATARVKSEHKPVLPTASSSTARDEKQPTVRRGPFAPKSDAAPSSSSSPGLAAASTAQHSSSSPQVLPQGLKGCPASTSQTPLTVKYSYEIDKTGVMSQWRMLDVSVALLPTSGTATRICLLSLVKAIRKSMPIDSDSRQFEMLYAFQQTSLPPELDSMYSVAPIVRLDCECKTRHRLNSNSSAFCMRMPRQGEMIWVEMLRPPSYVKQE